MFLLCFLFCFLFCIPIASQEGATGLKVDYPYRYCVSCLCFLLCVLFCIPTAPQEGLTGLKVEYPYNWLFLFSFLCASFFVYLIRQMEVSRNRRIVQKLSFVERSFPHLKSDTFLPKEFLVGKLCRLGFSCSELPDCGPKIWEACLSRVQFLAVVFGRWNWLVHGFLEKWTRQTWCWALLEFIQRCGEDFENVLVVDWRAGEELSTWLPPKRPIEWCINSSVLQMLSQN